MKKTDDKSVSNSLSSKIEHLRRYCAYQERSRSQLKLQASKIGVPFSKFDEVLMLLSEEGFFNEERFAFAFVKGKFNVNKWGKLKIKAEMYAKQINSDLIQMALNEINDEDYRACLNSLIKKKYNTFKNETNKSAFEKLFRYAVSKGFESDLILNVLNSFFKENIEYDL